MRTGQQAHRLPAIFEFDSRRARAWIGEMNEISGDCEAEELRA